MLSVACVRVCSKEHSLIARVVQSVGFIAIALGNSLIFSYQSKVLSAYAPHTYIYISHYMYICTKSSSLSLSLSLSLSGHSTLMSSLQSVLASEFVDGYRCSGCSNKVQFIHNPNFPPKFAATNKNEIQFNSFFLFSLSRQNVSNMITNSLSLSLSLSLCLSVCLCLYLNGDVNGLGES